MTPGRYNIKVYRGATFQLKPRWKIDGKYVNLSGYSANMVVRNSPTSTTSIITLSTFNGRITMGGADGTFTLNLTSAETFALAAGQYVYDIELTSPGNQKVTRLLEGGFIVYEGVTS
jgi:hypothetical protein